MCGNFRWARGQNVGQYHGFVTWLCTRKVDVGLSGTGGNSNSHGLRAGPPNHHDDKVDSDPQVFNIELSLAFYRAILMNDHENS